MTSERALSVFVVPARVFDKPYHALLLNPIVLTTTEDVVIGREDGGFTPEPFEVEMGVPLAMGVYAFTSKENRDRFVRRANAESELENAIAVKLAR